MKHSTLRNARGGIEFPDSPLPERSRLDILQEQIATADQLIALHDLPTIIRLAQEMKARALEEIQKMVDAELQANVSATHGTLNLLAADHLEWLDWHQTQEGARF